jgi:hypothetical protein
LWEGGGEARRGMEHLEYQAELDAVDKEVPLSPSYRGTSLIRNTPS